MSKVVPLEGFGGGGSSPLNFKIVAYATEEELVAATPPENTIGVVTTTPLNGWIFSSEEPTENLVDGLIWVQIDSSSDVAFNALKKNSMMVYPSISYQYLSGSWNELTTKSYLNNSWVDWYVWDGYLYNAGDECTDITGGWKSVAYAGGAEGSLYAQPPTVTRNTSSIKVTPIYQSTAGIVRTTNLIDFSKYDNLEVVVSALKRDISSSKVYGAYIYAIDENDNYVATQEITSTGTQTLNISSLDGLHYAAIFVYQGGSTAPYVTFTSIKLS